ncbi:MAG TPA: RDD family protein [Usitatibacteraceae bacterium]
MAPTSPARDATAGSKPPHLQAPPLWRRLAALPYEGLLLLAIGIVAAFPTAGLKGLTLTGIPNLAFKLCLLAISAVYFIWFWRHGGQTLPMKTWRFKVVDLRGQPLRTARAILRFLCALLLFGPAAIGLVLLFFPHRVSPTITMWAFLPMIADIWWSRFDAQRQYLHDRLAGTRLVDVTSG